MGGDDFADLDQLDWDFDLDFDLNPQQIVPQAKPFDMLEMFRGLCGHSPELLWNVLSFLVPYEQVGLGRVSKEFKTLVHKALGYDPFGFDPTMPLMEDLGYTNKYGIEYPDMQPQWANLGLADLSSKRNLTGQLAISPDDVDSLQAIAKDAFTELHKGVTKLIRDGQALNQPVDFLATVLKNNLNPNGDCVATMRIGGAEYFSTNFKYKTNWNMQKAQQSVATQLLEDRKRTALVKRLPEPAPLIQVPVIGSKMVVTKRHAEIRLVLEWRLALPYEEAEAPCVDKVCCIFCAAQLRAMGLGGMVSAQTGSPFKALAWYNFAPQVMFFKRTRQAMWGAAVDERFSALTPVQKRQVLFYIVKMATPLGLKPANEALPQVKELMPPPGLPSGPGSGSGPTVGDKRKTERGAEGEPSSKK